jgi:3-phenylpropionate/cinnamic acid dioxygenase small subunit
MNGTIDLPSIEAFLFEEARLLDERRYDEWVALFDEEATYWVPSGHDGEAAQSVALIYDNVPRLRERLIRLKAPTFWAQQPPTQTTRLIGNVTARPGTDRAIEVESRFIMTLLRRNQSSLLSGVARHQLKLRDGRYTIHGKVVELQQRDQPFDNLTFLI